jgi:hypothetical protein
MPRDPTCTRHEAFRFSDSRAPEVRREVDQRIGWSAPRRDGLERHTRRIEVDS